MFKIYGVRGCPGCSSVQLCRICLGDGRCGPISINLILSRMLSSEIPDRAVYFYSFDLSLDETV